MIEFPAPVDVFWLKAREEWVFCYDKDTEYFNVRSLFEKTIKVENNLYEVRGVEHFAIVCEGLCTHGFGLLVESIEKV